MSVLRRASRSPVIDSIDPLTRISENFILGDFLGNQSVFAKGYANPLNRDPASLTKMDNLGALCRHGLETVLSKWGPLSVSYGYISPQLSREIVKYQDPDKPSHHRFDLGAAADICVHKWVHGDFIFIEDLFLPTSAVGSPIALAHAIDQENIPYSRLITYSESPYICLALSSTEVSRRQPRKAFYENRYQGRPKDKPEYIQYTSQGARDRGFTMLQEQGLEHPWQGSGYPTYHGGGYRQFHHVRVSKYTMVSDFLLDLKSIAIGAKNVPSLNLDSVQDAFAAAGTVYDKIVDHFELKRLSVVAGYVSPTNPHFDKGNDWRTGNIEFSFLAPINIEGLDTFEGLMPGGIAIRADSRGVITVSIEVEDVLRNPAWE